MPAQSPPDRLVIFYDDLTDSDNWTAARFVHKWASVNEWRVVWIVEPRQVSFGLDMTEDQKSRCQKLIQKHFPDRGGKNAFKVLLAGLIGDSDLAKVDQADHEILKLAIKRPHSSKEDAVLHGRLVASDFLTCVADWSDGPVEVFQDVESLSTLENPVNLNMHHHEELTARTPEELTVYNSHMKLPFPQRVEKLREWYGDCNKRLEKGFAQKGSAVRDLDLNDLCSQIKAAKEVKYFGGGSLGILKRLYEQGVAGKMQCYMQAGAFDLSRNLFPNQFNILLNPKAAKSTFTYHKKWLDFAVVPTTTTQSIKYPLGGLAAGGGEALAKRYLGFNCHIDPMKIATGEITLNDPELAKKLFFMPDLTAFLCTFIPNFRGTRATQAVQVETRGGVLTLEKSSDAENSFKVMEREPLVEMSDSEIQELFSSLGQHST